MLGIIKFGLCLLQLWIDSLLLYWTRFEGFLVAVLFFFLVFFFHLLFLVVYAATNPIINRSSLYGQGISASLTLLILRPLFSILSNSSLLVIRAVHGISSIRRYSYISNASSLFGSLSQSPGFHSKQKYKKDVAS